MSWDIVRLGDVCEINMGKTPSRNNPTYWEGDNSWVAISDLKGARFISKTKEGITEKGIKESGIKRVSKGTLLYSFKLSIGKVAITETEIFTNEAIAALPIKNPKILDLGFLYWAVQVIDLEGIGDKAVKGITLNKEKLKDLPIPLPPLSTQKRIAEILDTSDALRRKDQELLRKYDELAQAIFIDMFGDPVRNEKGWEVKKLGHICTKITDGTHDTPERLTSGVKFITGKHIRPYTIDYENSDYVTEEIHKEIYRRCNPEIGDILYTNIGVNYATAAMNTVEYEFSMKNVALLKYNRKIITGRFLEYLLNNEFFKDKLKKLTGIGGAQQFLSLAQIKDINILVPSKSLQNKFDIIIDGLTPATNNLNIANNKSEFLFLSLLQKAFKGELIP